MPISYEAGGGGDRAVFEGHCAPEEADALLDWLRRTPDPAADLARCDALHTALAQLLLAARVRLVAPPPDELVAACLGAWLPLAAAEASPEGTADAVAPGKPRRARRGRPGASTRGRSKVPT
jgi:hypothetical protein